MAPPAYAKKILGQLHPEVLARYYGCGLVLPDVLEGLRILDLGCGAGRDVYLLARLVGSEGSVLGVDMTPEQLAVARAHSDFHRDLFGYKHSNVEFMQGNIEALDALGLEESSFDLIVSNCVINLAVDKAAVLNSARRLLKPGGEMYFSDIYADRRIPSVLVSDPILYGECLAGAMYWQDFMRLSSAAGFAEPCLVESEPVNVTDPELSARVGEIGFASATYRLFNVAGQEAAHEDYGQEVRYKGSIEEAPEFWSLDAAHIFPTGAPVAVSSNIWNILAKSRFSEHFQFIGDNSVHFGAFSSKIAAPSFVGSAGGGCC